jgi:hypothetical protein
MPKNSRTCLAEHGRAPRCSAGGSRDRQQALAAKRAGPVLHVLRHVDDHRPGPAGAGDLEGRAHRRFELFGVGDQEGVLGDRPHELETGASWKASVPIAGVGTCPQITTIGIESAMQSRTGVTVLVAPGPDVTMTTPTLPLARA